MQGSLVFYREHVHNTHTKRRWLREGRQVIEGEKPCKVVKQQQLKTSNNVAAEADDEELHRVPAENGGDGRAADSPRELEVFGGWQTEPYEAPVAVDGVVPKNERGQVDLFHEAMLPKGCRHLQQRGISRIARDLGIDYAPAFVGFERTRGRITPQFDGVVVCKDEAGLLVS